MDSSSRLGAALLGAALFIGVREARADWSMYNHDATGSRHNTEERTLGPQNVGQLAVKWSFPTVGAVSSTPTVSGSQVYAGDVSGAFYSLRARDGQLQWRAQAVGSVSSSAAIKGRRVVFGDLAGFIYGLDRDTGALAWKIRPNPHPLAAIWGSPTVIGPHIVIGVATNEEAATLDPNYPCCSARGSVILLDPDDGHVVWQTYMLSNQELAAGSSGVAVWSSPSYDAELGLIYVTTGNNYSAPATAMSDAIVALDARTGDIVWVNQRHANDTWNFRFPPSSDHPDFDFGDSAQIYRLPNGRKVVGAGQKSGFYHVLDAATGELVNQAQFEVGASTGGLFSDSAFADGVVFANGSDWSVGTQPQRGDIIAFSGDATQELWRFTTPFEPNISGVAVANGVVYFSSMDGNLYGLSAATGTPLAQLQLGAFGSGPAVSGGRVYVGTGDALATILFGSLSPATIFALGLPHDDD